MLPEGCSGVCCSVGADGSHSSYTICLQDVRSEHPTHGYVEVTSDVGHFPTDRPIRTLPWRAQGAQPG